MLRICKRLAAPALLLALFASALCSCGGNDSVVYSEFFDIPSAGWRRLASLSFAPMPVDSVTDHDPHVVELILRHSDALPFDTIWLAVEESSFGVVIHNDTIPLALANSNGEWLGKGAHALYEVSDTLRTFSRLPAGYSITVTHAMADDNLPGVKNIGIRLIRQPQDDWKRNE